MRYIRSCILIGGVLLPVLANAQVYKCVDAAGHTSYSQVPCPQGVAHAQEMKLQHKSMPSVPAPAPGNESERMNKILEWAYERYPFLDASAPAANHDAIREVMRLKALATVKGDDPADALLAAIEQVGPVYLSQEIVRRNVAAADIMQGKEATGRLESRKPELVVVGQVDEHRSKMDFQIDWLRSRANREADPGRKAALRSAIRALEQAPVNDVTLRIARDAVSAADRGKVHEAASLARQALLHRGDEQQDRHWGVSAPASQPARVITSCDSTGCWDSLGGRYNKGADSTYFPASGGPVCQMIGSQMHCP